MVTIYVTSLEEGSGKTTVYAGIIKYLQDSGKKAGYFKPAIAADQPAEGSDRDAIFMKQVFALEDPVNTINPSYSDDNELVSALQEDLKRIAEGKDVVIVEAANETEHVSSNIVNGLNARVILVAADSEGPTGDKLLGACEEYKDNLLGVVLNKVPANQIEYKRSELMSAFQGKGINILGVLPEDRTLLALSVGELAEQIHGEILNNKEKSDGLVENVMLGALVVDSGPYYFGRKVNKAAVLRTERQDMQMAALETSTSTLVLSGNTPPNRMILNRAEDKSVPIIQTSDDVTGIVTIIEDALTKTRFNQEKKLAKLDEIMRQNFDFTALV